MSKRPPNWHAMSTADGTTNGGPFSDVLLGALSGDVEVGVAADEEIVETIAEDTG